MFAMRQRSLEIVFVMLLAALVLSEFSISRRNAVIQERSFATTWLLVKLRELLLQALP